MLITQPNAAELIQLPTRTPLELAIAVWLDAKSKKSKSKKTATAYHDTITDFRALLWRVGIDLDGDPHIVTDVAQAYAGSSRRLNAEVSASTYNQRLAILSSFYTHARKRGALDIDNPIARVDRRSTKEYQHARPLEKSEVSKSLQAIDRTTIEGKRDYALLSVALSTGRRVSELANLRRADLHINANQLVTVTFQCCKGGKEMTDALSRAVSSALIDYLYSAFGADFNNRPANAPIWISVSRADQGKGSAIGIRAISNICLKRVGTSKVHTLRHTFAHMMNADGAAASVIQAKLGHESLATTGRYLAALSSADNPHADSLARAMGIT